MDNIDSVEVFRAWALAESITEEEFAEGLIFAEELEELFDNQELEESE